jgi:hypothetical protein
MAVSGNNGAPEDKDLTSRGIGSGAIDIECESEQSGICQTHPFNITNAD